MGMFDAEDTINDVMNSWGDGVRYAQKIIYHKNNYRAVKSLIGQLCKEKSNPKIDKRGNNYPYIAIRKLEPGICQYIFYSKGKMIVVDIEDKKVTIHDRYRGFWNQLSDDAIYRFDDETIDIMIETLKSHITSTN